MDNNEVINIKRSTIESLNSLKRIHPKGVEYWLGRELQDLLGYSEWRNFKYAIDRAKMACDSVGNNAVNHFADVNKLASQFVTKQTQTQKKKQKQTQTQNLKQQRLLLTRGEQAEIKKLAQQYGLKWTEGSVQQQTEWQR